MTAPYSDRFEEQMAAYADYYGFEPNMSNFGWWGVSATPNPLGEREVIAASWDPSRPDTTPGRRLRVFAALIFTQTGGVVCSNHGESIILTQNKEQSYQSLLSWTEKSEHRDYLGSLKFRMMSVAGTPAMIDSIQSDVRGRNPELPNALQDLGDEINEDVREACLALRNPDLWYPGIDEGIEPVPDDHVDLVIWALQRELDRELRQSPVPGSMKILPAPPLMDLPRRVKRALAERRRWRFKQYGIGREEWEQDRWSLWKVREDPEWVPRRQLRIQAETPAV